MILGSDATTIRGGIIRVKLKHVAPVLQARMMIAVTAAVAMAAVAAAVAVAVAAAVAVVASAVVAVVVDV